MGRIFNWISGHLDRIANNVALFSAAEAIIEARKKAEEERIEVEKKQIKENYPARVIRIAKRIRKKYVHPDDPSGFWELSEYMKIMYLEKAKEEIVRKNSPGCVLKPF